MNSQADGSANRHGIGHSHSHGSAFGHGHGTQHGAHHGGHHGAHHGIAHGADVDKRLAFSVGLNLIITAAQVVGGIISGSLALLSDALHNFSDASSLLISLVASRLSKRKPTKQMTFGFRRAEIVGAFVNLITLGVVAIFIVKEAVHRIVDPQPVDTFVLLVVATIGLLANVFTALLLRRDAQDSVNIKSAYIHIMMDALSSVAVIFGGIVIYFSGWTMIDPILSILIAAYIAYFGWMTMKTVTDILMEAVPPAIDITRVVSEIRTVNDVVDAHHVHVWMIDEKSIALEAHIMIDSDKWEHMESAKAKIKELLGGKFGITHSTLEFEISDVPCADTDSTDCY